MGVDTEVGGFFMKHRGRAIHHLEKHQGILMSFRYADITSGKEFDVRDLPDDGVKDLRNRVLDGDRESHKRLIKKAIDSGLLDEIKETRPPRGNKMAGARDMLREAAKQFRQLGDNGHAAMCELHADVLGTDNGAIPAAPPAAIAPAALKDYAAFALEGEICVGIEVSLRDFVKVSLSAEESADIEDMDDLRGLLIENLADKISQMSEDDLGAIVTGIVIAEVRDNQTDEVIALHQVDRETLADREFELYDFGEGVQITDSSRWDASDPMDWIKKAYATYEDDDADAPSHAISFHVRFNDDGSVSEAYGLECDKGNVIGRRPGGDEVPVGTEGVLRTLNGDLVIGTEERLSGTHGIVGATRREDGTLDIEFSNDGTELDWDGSETATNEKGERLFVTSTGGIVPESQVVVVPARPAPKMKR
jgi:hypothetical protein